MVCALLENFELWKVDFNLNDASHPRMLKVYACVQAPEVKAQVLEVQFFARVNVDMFKENALHKTYRVTRLLGLKRDPDPKKDPKTLLLAKLQKKEYTL